MRTTVTIDPDVELLLRRSMSERKVGFKMALNEALRRGLRSDEASRRFRVTPRDMGRARVPLEKALQLAADLEDAEIIRKLKLRK